MNSELRPSSYRELFSLASSTNDSEEEYNTCLGRMTVSKLEAPGYSSDIYDKSIANVKVLKQTNYSTGKSLLKPKVSQIPVLSHPEFLPRRPPAGEAGQTGISGSVY